MAVLWTQADQSLAGNYRELQDAAQKLGIQLHSPEVRGPDDFVRAFETATTERAEAVITLGGTLIVAYQRRIVDLAAQHRLPTMYHNRDSVAAGGLMAYGVHLPDLFRRVATYVDKILKGAKPADLPVEQPMTFDFVVNLKTAQALGITFPNEIMLQVTEVVQ